MHLFIFFTIKATRALTALAHFGIFISWRNWKVYS